MNKRSGNIYYHFGYWIFVILVLTKTFGFQWGNNIAAFYFVCMLLPIVLGTSYFFNYVLVPKFFLTKRYARFAFYTFCTAVVSLYLEMIVLVFSFVYLVNFNYQSMGPSVRQTKLLAAVLYLLVFVGSFILMMHQIIENRKIIQQLLDEKGKMQKSFLEIMSNRKMVKIPYDEIIYIESLSDYIKIITANEEIVSKEKISRLAERLPDIFLRIHRSFIINTRKIKKRSMDEVIVANTNLTIGRSYRKEVKGRLNGGDKTPIRANTL